MSFKPVCANCETDQYLVSKTITDDFVVKNDNIRYSYSVLECSKCGELASTPEENDQFLKDIYDIYKRKHNLLTTDEIIAIRDYYSLSLRDFSKILGISHITYHRYEKGAIPDTALNNLLILVNKNPANLLKLFKGVRDTFSSRLRNKILDKISDLIREDRNEFCDSCYYKIFEEVSYIEEKTSEIDYTNPTWTKSESFAQIGKLKITGE